MLQLEGYCQNIPYSGIINVPMARSKRFRSKHLKHANTVKNKLGNSSIQLVFVDGGLLILFRWISLEPASFRYHSMKCTPIYK